MSEDTLFTTDQLRWLVRMACRRKSLFSWSDHADAWPLLDILRAHEVMPELDSAARGLLNRRTLQTFQNNRNRDDLHGMRTTSPYWFLQTINQLLAGDDLPQLSIEERLADGVVLLLPLAGGISCVLLTEKEPVRVGCDSWLALPRLPCYPGGVTPRPERRESPR